MPKLCIQFCIYSFYYDNFFHNLTLSRHLKLRKLCIQTAWHLIQSANKLMS